MNDMPLNAQIHQSNKHIKYLEPIKLPLRGSTLIEASAGTGKTYTIAMLYVRLILGHGQIPNTRLADNLLPRDILVVTFTEAATKELSDRIRNRIAQAAEVFSDQYASEQAPELSDLIDFRDAEYPNPQTWPACQKKLLLALEYMDEAAISTIHSWCYRMLSEHAFNSGSLFDLEMIKDERDIIYEAMQDYWRIYVYSLPRDIGKVFRHHFASPELLLNAIGSAYKQSEHFAVDENALQKLPVDLYAQLDTLRTADWATMQQEVSAFFTQIDEKKVPHKLHKGSAKAMLKALDGLIAWSTSSALFPDNIDSAGVTNFTHEVFAVRVKGGEIPPLAILDVVTTLSVLHDLVKNWKQDIVIHAGYWLNVRVQQVKKTRALLGFDDLINGLHKALLGSKGKALEQAIKQQFPVVLIDEFQDTDNVQYQIFDQIYDVASNNQNNCLIVIGDPKQAIYSFRGGDIYTYLSARNAVGDSTYTLGKNFRSTQNMVSAVNHIFASAEQRNPEGAFLFCHDNQQGMPFEPVAANGLDDALVIDGELQSALTFYVSMQKPSVTNIAESTASQVVALLSKSQQGNAGFQNQDNTADLKAISTSDIAIIVNSGSEASALQSALSERNLRSYYVSDKSSILTTTEAREMLIWLRAVAEPKQVSLIRSALGTSLLGISHVELQQNLEDESHLDTLINQFDAFHMCWQQRGLLPMLREFLSHFSVQAQLLQNWHNGERVLTNILHISELLQEASLQVDTMQNLIHHYEQLLVSDLAGNDFLLPRLESESGLIQIVTIHKSKGLQYPIVFLPYATSAYRKVTAGDWVRYHDENHQAVTTLTPNDEIKDKANKEALGEDIRKLYVALTRAKYCTFVGASNGMRWFESGLSYLLGASKDDDIATLLSDLAKEQSNILISTLPDAEHTQYERAPKLALGEPRTVLNIKQEYWYVHSYSSIGYEHNSQVFDESANLEKENHHLLEGDDNKSSDANLTMQALPNLHNFPRGAGPGTFLHNILEWCCLQGFGKVLETPSILHQYIENQVQLQGWQRYTDVLVDWVSKLLVLNMPVNDLSESVSLIDLQSLQAEMEFLFTVDHAQLSVVDDLVQQHCFAGQSRPSAKAKDLTGVFKGFIDLTFEYKGKYYVLDYKSNHLGDDNSAYSAQNIEESIVSHRYDLQFVIYLVALHRLLKSRLPDYDYERHVGGAVYYFLRGVEANNGGIFYTKPNFSLIDQVDKVFSGVSANVLKHTEHQDEEAK